MKRFDVVATWVGLSLAVVSACEEESGVFGGAKPVTNASFAGVWTGQGGGLDVELDLGNATCQSGCEGRGGYDYTYAPGSVSRQSNTGVEYFWSGSGTAPPAPADTVRIDLYDGVNQYGIHFRVARTNANTLTGWTSIEPVGQSAVSVPITLTR